MFNLSAMSGPGAMALALTLSGHSAATIPDYSQDFESPMLVTDNDPFNGGPDDDNLAVDGWRVYANVFDGVGVYPGAFKFGYGLFDAPNGGPGFSSVSTGDVTNGGVGTQYLNVYSDYNCCDIGAPFAQGHGDDDADGNFAFDVINALTLREYNISSDDIGKSVTFTFDAKRPDFDDDGFGGDLSFAVANGTCVASCTAQAFIKTIDPGSGYSQTNYLIEDMTSISQSDWTTFSITFDLTDPLLDGQLLQVGFESFSSQFDNTGVYYDNVSLTAETPTNVPLPALALAGVAVLLGAIGVTAGPSARRVK